MSRRRQRVLYGVGAGVVLLSIFLLCMLSLPPRMNSAVSRADFERITVGMTLPQVEAILGPGTKVSGGGFVNDSGTVRPAVTGSSYYQWPESIFGNNYIVVALDDDGKVCDKYLWEAAL